MNVKNDRDESRMASGTGRLFQVCGPATANDLSPNEVCVRGMWSFPLSADLILGRRSAVGWQNSDWHIIYCFVFRSDCIMLRV